MLLNVLIVMFLTVAWSILLIKRYFLFFVFIICNLFFVIDFRLLWICTDSIIFLTLYQDDFYAVSIQLMALMWYMQLHIFWHWLQQSSCISSLRHLTMLIESQTLFILWKHYKTLDPRYPLDSSVLPVFKGFKYVGSHPV